MDAARARAARLTPPKRRTKAATVLAKNVVREIQRRGLQPGAKLLSEQRMVERYGVARGSLREALRYLELHGVLRLKSGPGGGPVIEAPNGRHFAGTLALVLQMVAAPFRTIIETRWVVEPGMVALAAQRAKDADLQALRASLDAMRGALRDAARFQEENRRFHDLLAVASGNAVFRFLLPALHWISDGAGVRYSEAERRRILRAMRRLFAAIEARDPQSAARLMERFFAASLEYLDRRYPSVMLRRVSWSESDL